MNLNNQYSLGCVIVVFWVVAGYNNGVGERPALGWNTWYEYNIYKHLTFEHKNIVRTTGAP